MKKRITVAYVVCIHLLLVFVLLKSDFIQRIENKLGIMRTQSEITGHFHRMLRYHSRIDGNVPNSSVLFIGDSITQGLCVSAVSSPSVNYGIGSDTSKFARECHLDSATSKNNKECPTKKISGRKKSHLN